MVTETTTPVPGVQSPVAAGDAATPATATTPAVVPPRAFTASSPTSRGGTSSFATTLKDRLKRTSSFAAGVGAGVSCTNSNVTTGAGQAIDSGSTGTQPVSKEDVWSLLSLRCRAWKQLVKTLVVYFSNITDVQEASARGYAKAAAVLVAPQNFGGGHFIEPVDPTKRRAGGRSGGILAVMHDLHHTTRMFAEADARSCNTLVDTAINTLDRLKKQMKARGDELSNESRSSATQVERMRELTKKKFVELGKAIEIHKHQPGVNCLDPWLANHAVCVQLNSQLNAERDYNAAAVLALQAFADFEKSRIIHDVRMVLSSFVSNYGSFTSSGAADVQTAVEAMQASVENLMEDAEWNAFLEKNDQRLSVVHETVPALENVPYEHRDDDICRTVRQGTLERKRFGGWKQEVWVLTAGGWMHSFSTSDLLAHATPEKSIYVAGSQLHPPHTASESQPREFSLLEKGKGGAFHLSEHRYRLRAANYDDATSWWKALSQFARPTAFTEAQRPSATSTSDGVKGEQGKEVATPVTETDEHAAQNPEMAEERNVEDLGVHERAKEEPGRLETESTPVAQTQEEGGSSPVGKENIASDATRTAESTQQSSPTVALPSGEVANDPKTSVPAEVTPKRVDPLPPSSNAAIPAGVDTTRTEMDPAR